MNKLNINSSAKKYRTSFLTAFILFCLISIPAFAEESLIILYTGSVLGELKPCGCAEEGDLGGILRRATIIEKERSTNKNILLLDAGDSFKEPTGQGKLKAKTMIEGLNKMGYDAALLGEKDFVYGEEIFNQGSFDHWVLSNVENKNIKDEKTINYYLKKFDDGTKVAVIGLLGPELIFAEGQTKLKIEDPAIRLEKILRKLKADGEANIILLLTHMEKNKAKELFNFDGVDIVINGHLDETDLMVNPEITGKKIMVHVRERGQYLGKISVAIDKQKIQKISNEYIPLNHKINDSQLVQSIYDKYNEETKQLFLKWLQNKKSARKGNFITEIACKKCHKHEYAVWKKSGHSHSFKSLKEANKTFDPECLICHTTGFKQDGGFLSESTTPKLINVQCEACHGAGSSHMKLRMRDHITEEKKLLKLYKKLTEDSCLACHTRENSPNYKFSTYWKKIKH
tara:strand:+ start:3107 stop:4474 length:1368 start_codon:yes stop_codon:yes gene_type:complete